MRPSSCPECGCRRLQRRDRPIPLQLERASFAVHVPGYDCADCGRTHVDPEYVAHLLAPIDAETVR